MKILFVILGVLLLSVIPYLLGCSNGAILVSRFILRDDIRHHGSGNAGLTNFYRTFGGGLTFLVILADVLKAVFALLLGMLGAYLLRRSGIDAISALRAKYISGLFCELGHMFPVTFGFKGGKGIMSGGIIAIMIDWRVAVVVWGSFLILAIATKYVSLGSVSTGILFPIMAWILWRDWLCLLCAILIGGLIVFQHRSNIQRLIHGTESKFSFHRKKE
ncbi:MAG: glycerol-3-phosphate acyltransferase [Oscillospiraceae bacterium]|nr:glycerol-3-phosphate acyltransferase [Oscillospiraceae bacterium]